MSNTAQSLSLERKIKMHEAREGIINRLAMTLPRAINLDRFLTVIVSELGRMMEVDRASVMSGVLPKTCLRAWEPSFRWTSNNSPNTSTFASRSG
jgi:hypothetical protein